MLNQEVHNNTRKVQIYIPETKRFNPINNSLPHLAANSTFFPTESPFWSLKIQFQDLKPQLGLRTQNSGFTKVCSVDDECGESFKQQNTRAPFFTEESEQYRVNLQRLIELIQKADNESEKDQKQFTLNTKNILRNVCNAQNQYILFNLSAQQIIDCHLESDSKFKAWVNKLRFHTFEEFQRVWSCNKRSLFTKLYKKLCRKFYMQNAVPYIINSRIKNTQTKITHIRYMYRFLEGIENPSDFYYFKQKEKEKSILKESISEKKIEN